MFPLMRMQVLLNFFFFLTFHLLSSLPTSLLVWILTCYQILESLVFLGISEEGAKVGLGHSLN